MIGANSTDQVGTQPDPWSLLQTSCTSATPEIALIAPRVAGEMFQPPAGVVDIKARLSGAAHEALRTCEDALVRLSIPMLQLPY